MSGIPLTMKTVGQTCSLTAVVYYQNGTQSFNETIHWSSSNPSVAFIDQYGNLYSYGVGTTTITATTDRPMYSGQPATDSAELTVTNQTMNYMNVFPDFRRRMADFNAELANKGVQLYLLDSDPEEVKQSSFADQFKSAYGVEGFQLTDITEEHNPQFTTDGGGRGASTLKPYTGLSMATLEPAGGLVPLRFIYNLTWDEVGSILGRDVSTASDEDIAELFDYVSIEFKDENGDSAPVIGGSGISVADAKSSGALSVDIANSSLRIQLDAMLGDAEAVGRSPEYLIGKKIILADNSANENLKGELSLVSSKSVKLDQGNGGGGGGGGCNGGAVPAMLAVLLVLAATRARVRKK
jgi:hypothetical protein